MAMISVTVPFSKEELQQIDKAIQKITNNDLNSWLSNNLTLVMLEQFTKYKNPFVTDRKTAWPVIKYFKNKNQQSVDETQIDISFMSIPQDTLNLVAEILNNHGMSFWNFERLTVYFLTKLLTGSDKTFFVPVDNDSKNVFTLAHNMMLIQQFKKQFKK